MATMTMRPEAAVLARELVRRHEQVRQTVTVERADDVTDGMIGNAVIAYGLLCERAGVPFLTHGVGTFLGDVADWCAENGWPPLNSLAVNGDRRIPGEGYETATGCNV